MGRESSRRACDGNRRINSAVADLCRKYFGVDYNLPGTFRATVGARHAARLARVGLIRGLKIADCSRA